ncbi:MAG TPA: ABC transporter permease [Streptosporangiaceae bacterium]|jgi:NitT/TauT family transport system permease protein/taurine transport system permease protein|nr:ABC transporter permease [Streptosporangiaceae bacterium]
MPDSDWYSPYSAAADTAVATRDRPADAAGREELDDRAELLAQRRARRRARARRLATGAAGIAGLLILWQLAAMILGDQVALPSVTQTVAQFVHYLDRPYPAQGKPIWYDLYISLRRILIGFVIGVLAGIALGAAMSAGRVVRHLVDPVIEVLRPLPPLAFIPLFIVWLGIGELPKEVLIIVGVIPLMAVTTVAALDEVPDDLRLCARTLGASRRYTLLHVQIRSALPFILTGMRFAMAGAWSSIVAVELLAATSGLGFMIMQAGDYLDTALVFAGIITIAVAGLLLDAVLRSLLLLADPSRRR